MDIAIIAGLFSFVGACLGQLAGRAISNRFQRRRKHRLVEWTEFPVADPTGFADGMDVEILSLSGERRPIRIKFDGAYNTKVHRRESMTGLDGVKGL